MRKIKNYNNFFISGCCGTVGEALLSHIVKNIKFSKIICADNNEQKIFLLKDKYKNNKKIEFIYLDIRDENTLNNYLYSIDVVFHTAAIKHVTIAEKFPLEAIKTNILGVKNIINSSIKNNIKIVCFTSSDKAVNPSSVMGTSKLMGEKLISAANNIPNSKTIFFSTRFGNIYASSGSIVQIVNEQIKNKFPVTLTSKDMTRFIMTLDESVAQIVTCLSIAKGGEVFVLKMKVVNIHDLILALINVLSKVYNLEPKKIKIKTIGIQPGEKLYEELMSEEEVRRTIETKDFFIVLPAFKNIYNRLKFKYPKSSKYNGKPYISMNHKKMKPIEIEKYIQTNLKYLLFDDKKIVNRIWPN